MNQLSTARDRALGAFHGLALGDALGMPTQSLSREQIRARYGSIAVSYTHLTLPTIYSV